MKRTSKCDYTYRFGGVTFVYKFDFYVKLIKPMSMKELCARILNSSCFLIFTSSLVLIILFLHFPFQFTKNLEM